MAHPLVKQWQHSQQRLAKERAERDAAIRSGQMLCSKCGRQMVNSLRPGTCGKCVLELMGSDD